MIVYLIHNIQNEKVYVGITKHQFKHRWDEHCDAAYKYNMQWHLSNAIRLYGKDSFYHEILAVVATEEEAKILERLWIITLRSFDSEFGYNMTYGGDGVNPSFLRGTIRKEIYGIESEKQRGIAISLAKKGKPSWKKGTTNIELYGEIKAAKIAEQVSKTKTGKSNIKRIGKPGALLGTIRKLAYGEQSEFARARAISAAKKGKPSPRKGRIFPKQIVAASL